jgi:hypothetical protein
LYVKGSRDDLTLCAAGFEVKPKVATIPKNAPTRLGRSVKAQVSHLWRTKLFASTLAPSPQAMPTQRHQRDELVSALRRAMTGDRKGTGDHRGDWFEFGGSTHHRATANKILNRLQYALENQLKGIVRRSENEDNPIPIEELKP